MQHLRNFQRNFRPKSIQIIVKSKYILNSTCKCKMEVIQIIITLLILYNYNLICFTFYKNPFNDKRTNIDRACFFISFTSSSGIFSAPLFWLLGTDCLLSKFTWRAQMVLFCSLHPIYICKHFSLKVRTRWLRFSSSKRESPIGWLYKWVRVSFVE